MSKKGNKSIHIEDREQSTWKGDIIESSDVGIELWVRQANTIVFRQMKRRK